MELQSSNCAFMCMSTMIKKASTKESVQGSRQGTIVAKRLNDLKAALKYDHCVGYVFTYLA